MGADPRLAAIFTHIDTQRDRFVERLIDYVRHPSISAHNVGIREVEEILVGMLTGLGLDTRLIPTAGHPMVVARWLKAQGAPTVLLYGHYDVQPPDPLDLWITPPFEPTIRDGRIYARGSADNKGNHMAAIKAVEYARAAGGPPINVRFLIEGEEEITGESLGRYARDHAERLATDWILVWDGGFGEDGSPS